MSFDPKVIEALAQLRHAAVSYDLPVNVKWAIETLDNAGVFAALDEQTDYASAEEILAESARQTCPECGVHSGHRVDCSRIDWEQYKQAGLDPAERERGVGYPEQKSGRWAVADPDLAEWGDTTRADMARHQGVAGDQPEDELGFPLGGSLHSCVFGDKCPYPHAH